ncbi:MAG: DUF1461 domain-containing protein, partial [bacterium]|nr:DUF1461 domain-containing protein [bacterium]
MVSKIKYISLIARWLFILCIPLILLTAAITAAINSQWLYEYGFEKYNVGQTTGLEDTELKKVAGGLISYFNSGEEYIDITVIKDGAPFILFNEKEIIHLKDVKSLIWLNYYVMLGALIYVMLYVGTNIFVLKNKNYNQLASAAVWGSGITLGLILLLGVVAVTNFDGFFRAFHLISFANDFW